MAYSNYKPPYSYNESISNSLVEIGELLGLYQGSLKNEALPHLRRDSKVQTIHSSLAIENNRLSESQVTALLDGKRVLGTQKDILEVQNAFKAYDQLADFKSTSEDDFVEAHRLLTYGLVSGSGKYRNSQVGVFDGDAVIHIGSPVFLVPKLMGDLFSWLSCSKEHPLIKSCVFHYEMVFIHPFEDGNGRIARLWQSLILREWNPVFEFLPIETLVYENQDGYYRAIQRSNSDGNSTEFIIFMLKTIADSLKQALQNSDDVNRDVNYDVNRDVSRSDLKKLIMEEIKKNPEISIQQLSTLAGVSRRTIDRKIDELKQNGLLSRSGTKRKGIWMILSEDI